MKNYQSVELGYNPTHLYVTVTLESKYQLFIDGREKVGIKNLKKSKSVY